MRTIDYRKEKTEREEKARGRNQDACCRSGEIVSQQMCIRDRIKPADARDSRFHLPGRRAGFRRQDAHTFFGDLRQKVPRQPARERIGSLSLIHICPGRLTAGR